MFINKCLFFCLNYGSMSKLGDGIVFNDFSVLKPEKKSETWQIIFCFVEMFVSNQLEFLYNIILHILAFWYHPKQKYPYKFI